MQRKQMASVKDIAPLQFIPALAAHFKRLGKMSVPGWTEYSKTGAYKQATPMDDDWFYVRAASIARKVYIRGATGVGSFQRIYGGRKNNGVCPSHFAKSSGAVARHCLQQLEKLKILEKNDKGMRVISRDGRKALDLIAAAIKKQNAAAAAAAAASAAAQ